MGPSHTWMQRNDVILIAWWASRADLGFLLFRSSSVASLLVGFFSYMR